MGCQPEEERFELSDSTCRCTTQRQVTSEGHDEAGGEIGEYSARDLPQPKRAVSSFKSTVRVFLQ